MLAPTQLAMHGGDAPSAWDHMWRHNDLSLRNHARVVETEMRAWVYDGGEDGGARSDDRHGEDPGDERERRAPVLVQEAPLVDVRGLEWPERAASCQALLEGACALVLG